MSLAIRRSVVRAAIFLAATCLASFAMAQQPMCTVPVFVRQTEGEFLSSLSAEAFVAQDAKGSVRVQSVAIKQGPRRFIFVVENSRKMPDAARRIEVAVLDAILSGARQEDSFALVTARGPRVALKFGSSLDRIRAAAEDLGKQPQDLPKGQGVLDAVLEAVGWFEPPQPGDSIFLMALNVESKHHASFKRVRGAIQARGIRVFGIEVGQVSPPELNPQTTFDITTGAIGPGASDFDHFWALCMASGGAFAHENTQTEFVNIDMGPGKDKQVKYSLTDQHLQKLKQFGAYCYKAVGAPIYSLKFDAFGRRLTVGMSRATLAAVGGGDVIYPVDLSPCSCSAATKAVANGSSK